VEAHQVRVHDVGERPELALEAIDVLGVAQELERDLAAAVAVEGPVHLAHAAGPQGTPDHEAVGPEQVLADRGGHASESLLPAFR
jgi:hypothetical protein